GHVLEDVVGHDEVEAAHATRRLRGVAAPAPAVVDHGVDHRDVQAVLAGAEARELGVHDPDVDVEDLGPLARHAHGVAPAAAAEVEAAFPGPGVLDGALPRLVGREQVDAAAPV